MNQRNVLPGSTDIESYTSEIKVQVGIFYTRVVFNL